MCTHAYHEKQVLRHCVAHALNAFVGKQETSCDNLIKYAQGEPRLARLQKQTGALWDKDIGFLSPTIAFAWLQDRYKVNMKSLGRLEKDMTVAQKKAKLSKHDRFLVVRYENIPHMTTIHRHEKTFCWIDSDRPKPYTLGTKQAPWRLLYGTVFVAEPVVPEGVAPTIVDLD